MQVSWSCLHCPVRIRLQSMAQMDASGVPVPRMEVGVTSAVGVESSCAIDPSSLLVWGH